MSVSSEAEGGEPAASPMPTPMRVAKSWPKPCAAPPSAVMPLHTNRPKAMIVRRAVRSASHANGRMATKWTTANEGPSSHPSCASDSPRSRSIDVARMDTTIRSTTLNTATRNTTNIAYATYALE